MKADFTAIKPKKSLKMDATDIEVREEITESTNGTNLPKKTKLSGAARKRFRALLLNNVDKNEAFKLCRLSCRMIMEKVPGLVLQKDLEIEENSQKDQNNHNGSTSEGENLHVGIKNKEPMTEQELNLVRQALLASIIKCSNGQGPQFTDCSHKAGWLLITCENEKSKLWLEQQVPIIKPWPDAELSVMSKAEFPQLTGEVVIPSTETVEPSLAIALMRSQNFGLNTELWKSRSKVDERGLTLTVVLDDDSAEAIRNMNCKVQLGFSKVLFKLSDSGGPYTSNRLQAAQGESTSVLPVPIACGVATNEDHSASNGERSDAPQTAASNSSPKQTTASDSHKPILKEKGVYKLYKISSEPWNRTKKSCGDRQGPRKPWRDYPAM